MTLRPRPHISRNSALASLLLWVYAAGLLFVWYGAQSLPDGLVLVRVGASIISDLVWLPFGFLVWGGCIYLLIRRWVRPVIAVSAAVLTVPVILVDHQGAFKWMFAPLAIDIALLLPGVIRRNIRAATVFPLLAVTLLVAGYYRGQLVPPLRAANGGGVTLKVMSYNIFSLAGSLNRAMQIDTIRREDPDIVCVMEFSPRSDYPLLREQLGDRYPYMVSNRRETSWNSGELILSRYPVSSRRVVALPGVDYRMDFIFTELEVDGRIINLVSFHFITVGHDIIDQVFSSRSLAERVEAASLPEREKDHVKFEQAKQLVEFTERMEDPLIICGDMNDTPNSRVYRLLSDRYTNAFKAAGWGLGDTFGELSLSRRLPRLFARDVIRIDQIFVDEAFDVLSARVVSDAEGSDHKPVVAVVSLRDAPNPE